MSRQPDPIFLERQSYRRRRLGDAAKLLPLVGLALLLVPILWSDQASTGGGILYVFTIWAFLIAAAALISRRLSDYEPMDDPSDATEIGSPKDGSAR